MILPLTGRRSVRSAAACTAALEIQSVVQSRFELLRSRSKRDWMTLFATSDLSKVRLDRALNCSGRAHTATGSH